jgi:HK97 gp10 family phage protein
MEGGRELQAALAGLSKRVSRSIVKEVLTDAAEPIRRRAASNARRGPLAPHLANNIVINQTRRARDLRTSTEQAVAIGPARFYSGAYTTKTRTGHRHTEGTAAQAYLLEFGTSRTPAHPFLRPAFDSLAGAAVDDIGRRLWVELAGRGVSQSRIGDGDLIGGPGGSVL